MKAKRFKKPSGLPKSDWFGPTTLKALLFIARNSAKRLPTTNRAILDHLGLNPNSLAWVQQIVSVLRKHGLVSGRGKKVRVDLVCTCTIEVLNYRGSE